MEVNPEYQTTPKQNRLQELPGLLWRLIHNPAATMREPLRLSWPAALSLQAGAAMISGALVGLFSGNIWDLLIGVIIFPVTSVLAGIIFALFLFQFFSIFKTTLLDFQRVYSVVVLSTLPYYFVHILAGIVSPLDLLGFALTTILLIVGLVEQFGMDRRSVIKVMVGIYLLFFLAWTAATLTVSSDSSATEAASSSN